MTPLEDFTESVLGLLAAIVIVIIGVMVLLVAFLMTHTGLQ